MFLTPYTHLRWAYQLHYHLCFRTHRRRRSINEQMLRRTLDSVCLAHGYRLLQMKLVAPNTQLILSLQPQHRISDVMKIVKGESSAVLCRELGIAPPLWARGYLARSTGQARASAVEKYLETQAEHHGYAQRLRPPVFRYRAAVPKILTAAHASFDLKHHVVFGTTFRGGMFDSKVGRALVEYWLRVAAKHRFALDQATVVPDHVHLLVRITPKMSIEECALLLMNNGQHFVGKYWPERLIEAKVDQLWQASAYAGTCGDLSTALLKRFLENEE